MANLVTVTKEMRVVLKVGGAILSVILLFYFGIKGGSIIQGIFFPKPPPPPKQEFGKLPHITFPSQGAGGISYRINTVDGQLPQLPDRVNVYKLIKPEADLLALNNSRDILSTQYFTDNEVKISDTLYQWSQQRTGVIIQYDIATKNFTISSNYLTNPALSSTYLLPSEADIKKSVIDFLTSISIDTKDIDIDKSTVDYLQITNGALTTADNLGDAKFARVTLTQQAVDNIPIIYDTPTDSILNFVVSYPTSIMQPVEGQFFHHEPDLQQKSGYPIKTAQQALDDLKNGNAYVINPQNLTNVDITNVEVKYYLNKNSSNYLLPVIVFTGINFTAYVEAIPSSSLN